MNLLEMRTDLRQAIGNVSVNDVPDETLNKCINLANRYVSTVYPSLTSRAVVTSPTIPGQQIYAIPADCFAVRGVWDSDIGTKLTKRGERWAELHDWASGTGQGRPTDYVRFVNVLQLWPVPDGVYNIDVYYQQNIADLVADADLPTIAVPWHDGIVLKARWYYYDRIRTDIPKAASANTSWKMFLQEMPTSIDLENVDIDSGVVLPTLLRGGERGYARRDFDHSE